MLLAETLTKLAVKPMARGIAVVVMATVATGIIASIVSATIFVPYASSYGASYYSYTDIRSPLHELGYGGLSYAITPQYVNPYINTISMQFINHTALLSGVKVSLNQQGGAYAVNFLQGNNAYANSITGAALAKQLNDDVIAAGELDAFTALVVNRKALGFYVNSRTVLFPQDLKPIQNAIENYNEYEPVALSYDATNSVGAYYGHSISYLDSIYFGYNLQFVIRQTARQLRLVNNSTREAIIIANPDSGDKTIPPVGMGLLVDTTIAYIMEGMAISPTFVLFAKDIGGQLYSFNGLTTKVGLGTSVNSDIGPIHVTAGMEIGNILLSTLTLPGMIREIKAGTEVSLGNSLISVRGGLYKSRPTYGFGIFSYPVSLDYASYYEEVVGIPALKGDDKFIVNLNRPVERRLERRQSISMTIPF